MIMRRKRVARFAPGDLVRHRRYPYRGVVADYDDECRAPEGWYRSNQTQPARDQPWYHVLVDGSDQITYAAESSLMEEPVLVEVVHPLVPAYFERFEDGRYVRNERPWGAL